MKGMIRGSCLAVAGLVMAAAASAAEPSTTAPETAVTVQGVQVAIDPITGKLIAPTDKQRAALSKAMMQRSSAAPRKLDTFGQPPAPRNEAEARATFRTIRLKGGHTAVAMELPESLMSDLVAERRADGTVMIHHAGDAPDAPTAAEVTE